MEEKNYYLTTRDFTFQGKEYRDDQVIQLYSSEFAELEGKVKPCPFSRLPKEAQASEKTEEGDQTGSEEESEKKSEDESEKGGGDSEEKSEEEKKEGEE